MGLPVRLLPRRVGTTAGTDASNAAELPDGNKQVRCLWAETALGMGKAIFDSVDGAKSEVSLPVMPPRTTR